MLTISRRLVVAATVVACGIETASAGAQWSHNPAANTLIQAGLPNSDQNQPKMVATADGGCYIAWLDGIATGWDTRLQRLNSRGVKQWARGGTLVADTAFSSTEDYGLAIDTAGNALVAYRDDANSGSPVQIKVQKVNSAGAPQWGAGVQVSATSGGHSPHVCGTSDGGAIVTWSTSTGAAAVQKLDSNGVPQWTAGGVIDTPPAGLYSVCDVVSDNAGGAIVLYHHQTGTFSSPRYLKMQRFGSASGAKLWNGGSPLVVFDGSSIQLGYFPSMISDGAGGAVLSWYETGGSRNAYAQHVSQAGVEAFAHNGVAIADTIAGQARISGDCAYDSFTGYIYFAAIETNASSQSAWRVLMQRLDSSGNRTWSNSGKEIVPTSGNQPAFLTLQAWLPPVSEASINPPSAIVLYFDTDGSAAHVKAISLGGDGSLLWTPASREVCSLPSNKGRLWSVLNPTHQYVFAAWSDGRTTGSDIYAQNIDVATGSLGTPGDVNDDGSVNVNDLLAVITAWGPCPAPPTFCPADIVPPPQGDGQINVNDLLAVISNWG